MRRPRRPTALLVLLFPLIGLPVPAAALTGGAATGGAATGGATTGGAATGGAGATTGGSAAGGSATKGPAPEPTPYERIMANPAAPADPYYQTEPAWDATNKGPLPRWRIAPDGGNGTPAPPPGRSLFPRRFGVAGPEFAPAACRLTAPPEYSPTAGVLFRYEAGTFDDVVTDLVAALTGNPAHDELAYVVVANSAQQSSARTAFAAAGADLAKVRFIVMPTDSVWMRDYGPHFIGQGGADAIVDSHYYAERPLDNFIPTLLADDYFVNPSYDIPLYYSGGNFLPSADRHGFVTELILADNPTHTAAEIAVLYQKYQGVDTLHVMPQLPPGVDGTGHIDMWMYLVDEDTAIISRFLPGSDQEAIDITNNAVSYMQDLGYEVFRTPAFNAGHPYGWTHFTYTNAYRVNNRIFVTTYGAGNPAYIQYDDQALAAWQQAAGPGVEIVPVGAYDIIWASGAFHCVVMQVPRHTGTVPSACLTSPDGGEFLVPNSTHEITWTAADDAAVSSVDLYYSLDGGLTYPPGQTIATGLTDDGRHPWSVPLVESPAARVKVVARDAAGSAASFQSEDDVTIESASVHLYDFSTGAGTDKFAYGDKTTSWSEVSGVRRPVNAPLSNSNYARIAASDATGGPSDASRYVSSMTPADYLEESTHVFEFTIAEKPSTIREIAVRWEGFAESCTQMELYVWDDVARQWCDGRGQCGENRFMDNVAGNRDGTLRGFLRTDVARYVNAAGQLTFLLYAERNFDRSYHDYVSVTVTYDECLGPDPDFDGRGTPCDNCPQAANASQANADGDARGDACDCAVADATAFALPGEIRNVRYLTDESTLAWDSDAVNSGSGTAYQVLQGVAGQYPVGSGAGETCAASAVTGTSLGGLPAPAPATGYYQLVRGGNACGTGTYGFASGGSARSSAACP